MSCANEVLKELQCDDNEEISLDKPRQKFSAIENIHIKESSAALHSFEIEKTQPTRTAFTNDIALVTAASMPISMFCVTKTRLV